MSCSLWVKNECVVVQMPVGGVRKLCGGFTCPAFFMDIGSPFLYGRGYLAYLLIFPLGRAYLSF
jgi:hypothetical protein